MYGCHAIREVSALAERQYGAGYSELRPISGHVAGAAVLMGLCSHGDAVLEVGADGGGHRMAAKLAEASLIDFAWKPKASSRLTCQIVLTDALDGLILHVPERQL